MPLKSGCDGYCGIQVASFLFLKLGNYAGSEVFQPLLATAGADLEK